MGAVLLQAEITKEAEEALMKEINGGKCKFKKTTTGFVTSTHCIYIAQVYGKAEGLAFICRQGGNQKMGYGKVQALAHGTQIYMDNRLQWTHQIFRGGIQGNAHNGHEMCHEDCQGDKEQI